MKHISVTDILCAFPTDNYSRCAKQRTSAQEPPKQGNDNNNKYDAYYLED